MIPLIDGDLVAYRSAASCEPTKKKSEQEPLEAALSRLEDVMEKIMKATNSRDYMLWIGGSDNYRYKIDPTYKANRSDKPRPEWLQPCREYLVTMYGARVTDGIEADDAMGIHQNEDTVICSLDKDMLMVPGYHYNWVKEEFTKITKHQGWVNFYTQLILGDRSDNVLGYDGKMRVTIPQFLYPIIDDIIKCDTPLEMFNVVQDVYELGDDALLRNGRLLYIQQKEDDEWHFPT